ncbi:hypothetical protein, partial [Actinocorallia lasiicapitis]
MLTAVKRLIRPYLRPDSGSYITALRWRDGVLELAGRGGLAEVVLRERRSGREVVFPVARDGELFTAELPVGALPVFGAELPLPS